MNITVSARLGCLLKCRREKCAHIFARIVSQSGLFIVFFCSPFLGSRLYRKSIAFFITSGCMRGSLLWQQVASLGTRFRHTNCSNHCIAKTALALRSGCAFVIFHSTLTSPANAMNLLHNLSMSKKFAVVITGFMIPIAILLFFFIPKL